MKRLTLEIRRWKVKVTQGQNMSQKSISVRYSRTVWQIYSKCPLHQKNSDAKCPRSRSHEATDRFGGLAEASFSTPLAQIVFRIACVLLFTLCGRTQLCCCEDNKLFVPRSLTASTGPRAFCSSGPTSWNTSSLDTALITDTRTIQVFAEGVTVCMTVTARAVTVLCYLCVLKCLLIIIIIMIIILVFCCCELYIKYVVAVADAGSYAIALH